MNKPFKGGRVASAQARPRGAGPGDLPADACRLLARLGEAGADARPDPLVEDALVIRRSGGGVSVGGGRFAAADGRALAAADLATWNEAGTRLTITEAGRARLRRQAMPGDLAFAAQHHDLAVVVGVVRGRPSATLPRTPWPGWCADATGTARRSSTRRRSRPESGCGGT